MRKWLKSFESYFLEMIKDFLGHVGAQKSTTKILKPRY